MMIPAIVIAFTGLLRGINNFAGPVGHDDVLPLPQYAEARLLQGPDRVEMIDSGQPGHR